VWQETWPYIFVGIGTMIVDYLWAKCVLAVGSRSPVSAALWSAGVVLVSAWATIIYVGNHRTIIAAVLGAAVGTYLSVRQDKT
jgi:hypothetical protein